MNIEKAKSENLPKNKIGEKAEQFKKMIEARGGNMMKRQSGGGISSTGNNEKTVKIEHTRNEGNTVDLINNIKIAKVTKKKPKKVNFQ